LVIINPSQLVLSAKGSKKNNFPNHDKGSALGWMV
jgi:hypothetical protein